MNSHWAASYIGLPYAAGARGPAKVDCWGLIYLVYQNVWRRSVPLFPFLSLEGDRRQSVRQIKTELRQNWVALPKPSDGCGVAMSQSSEIHHVGLFADIDGGKIVHCDKSVGAVVAESVRRVRLRGYSTIKFYAYVLDH